MIIKKIAFLFIVAAVVFIFAGVFGYISSTINYVGIASALGTIAGAILVFSTLELQRKSLNEEKQRNEIERFNSRFYPIMSSFRTDASNMEIIGNYISKKGIGTTSTYRGERAFIAARSIITGLNRCLSDKSFTKFDMDEFEILLNNYSEMSDTLYEGFTNPDDIDKIEKERKEYIKSNQLPFIIEKWGITTEDRERYHQLDNKERESFLLDLFKNHQSSAFCKYIQSLRFILHIISTVEPDTERIIYYQHVSSLVGKEELEFLKCFSEFGKVTEVSYGKK